MCLLVVDLFACRYAQEMSCSVYILRFRQSKLLSAAYLVAYRTLYRTPYRTLYMYRRYSAPPWVPPDTQKVLKPVILNRKTCCVFCHLIAEGLFKVLIVAESIRDWVDHEN